MIGRLFGGKTGTQYSIINVGCKENKCISIQTRNWFISWFWICIRHRYWNLLGLDRISLISNSSIMFSLLWVFVEIETTKWRQDGVKTANKSEIKVKCNKKRAACHGVPLSFLPKMAPTRSQLGSQNGAKMAKKKDAFWDPFVVGFWYFLGPWMEPSWH